MDYSFSGNTIQVTCVCGSVCLGKQYNNGSITYQCSRCEALADINEKLIEYDLAKSIRE